MTAATYKISPDWNSVSEMANGATFDFVPIAGDASVTDSKESAARNAGAVSYFTITKCAVGFREASRLVSVANHTGSVIKLVSGKTVGTTNSILSIIKMGIKPKTSIGLFVVGAGGDTKAVFNECRKILSGE